MAIEFVYPTAEHCQALAADMRAQDVAEMVALGFSRDRLADVVENSVRSSTLKATITVDERVACIFGVAPINLLGGVGAVWLLATPHGQKHAGALMRYCRPYISEMLATFPLLVNMVHERNTASRRWLTRLGATFKEPVVLPSGATFIPFEMRADHV